MLVQGLCSFDAIADAHVLRLSGGSRRHRNYSYFVAYAAIVHKHRVFREAVGQPNLLEACREEPGCCSLVDSRSIRHCRIRHHFVPLPARDVQPAGRAQDARTSMCGKKNTRAENAVFVRRAA